MAFQNGAFQLQAGVQDYVIPFSPPFDGPPDAILPAVMNVSTETSKSLLGVTVVGKSSDDFTVHVDPAPPTDNYVVCWMAGAGGILAQLLITAGKRVSDLPVQAANPGDADYFPMVTVTPTPGARRLNFSTLKAMFPALTSEAPEAPSSPGAAGNLAVDENFIYLHNGLRWGRVAMRQSAWGDLTTETDGVSVKQGIFDIPAGTQGGSVNFITPFDSAIPNVKINLIVPVGSGGMNSWLVGLPTATGFTFALGATTPNSHYKLSWSALKVNY